MQNELRNKLLSSIILSTKPEPISLRLPARLIVSLGKMVSMIAFMIACLGLAMLLIAKTRNLF